ncbi:MAG: chemotaxis response regulator protein-glutamate methylesterase [Candidatus Korobacteraceae bacterium]
MTEPSANPIRVLVVDDSAFMRTALRRMIESDPALRVIDTACDGQEGVQKALHLRPDVITMDVEMPRMSGLDALSKIMEAAPCPVIMVSSLTRAHADATLEALSRGAYDFLSKDLSYASLDIVRIKDDLIAKCKAAVTRQRRPPQAQRIAPPVRESIYKAAARSARRFAVPRLVCLGTSTGGPKALQRILPLLPADLAVPVAIVQHMPPGFTGPFARRLDSLCKMRVKESEPNEPLLPGVIYIARAGEQLRVLRRITGACAHMSLVPTNTLHIPSVDVLMHSAAEQFGQHVMGVILTGMGCDGQQGMSAIYRAGGYTLGEDEATCTVYGMPRACAEAGILHNVLGLDAIPGEIVRMVENAGSPTASASSNASSNSALSAG